MINIRLYLLANSDKSLDYLMDFLLVEGYTKARISQCLKDYIDSKLPALPAEIILDIS